MEIVSGVSVVPARAIRIDRINSLLTYIGVAAVNSLNSDSVWQIRRITKTVGGVTTIEYADGDPKYNNIWDDRAILSYS
jgi:hypothetical protein